MRENARVEPRSPSEAIEAADREAQEATEREELDAAEPDKSDEPTVEDSGQEQSESEPPVGSAGIPIEQSPASTFAELRDVLVGQINAPVEEPPPLPAEEPPLSVATEEPAPPPSERTGW